MTRIKQAASALDDKITERGMALEQKLEESKVH